MANRQTDQMDLLTDSVNGMRYYDLQLGRETRGYGHISIEWQKTFRI